MKYPSTFDQRTEIVQAQSKACLLCGEHSENLVIDHDHRTGEVRGALCSQCNIGLGMFKDDPQLLYAAITYLDGYSGIVLDETPLSSPRREHCPGSWEPAVNVGARLYRCSSCDCLVGNVSRVGMELVGRGRYMVKSHYPRVKRPDLQPQNVGGRGPSKRVMSAVEAIS